MSDSPRHPGSAPSRPTTLRDATAAAWHRALPPYARNEVEPALVHEVDRLPRSSRREVLAAWDRAAAAGLYDPRTLRTIVEVVAGPSRAVPAVA